MAPISVLDVWGGRALVLWLMCELLTDPLQLIHEFSAVTGWVPRVVTDYSATPNILIPAVIKQENSDRQIWAAWEMQSLRNQRLWHLVAFPEPSVALGVIAQQPGAENKPRTWQISHCICDFYMTFILQLLYLYCDFYICIIIYDALGVGEEFHPILGDFSELGLRCWRDLTLKFQGHLLNSKISLHLDKVLNEVTGSFRQTWGYQNLMVLVFILFLSRGWFKAYLSP